MSYRRKELEGQAKFLCALVFGALAAHFGWALLYADRIVATPEALFRPTGWSVLFVPFGVLVAAPWGEASQRRQRYFRSAAASLPLALATARLGCLAAGCCHGTPTSLPWGIRLGGDAVERHPTALLDIGGLVLLHLLTAHGSPRFRVPIALGGFGVLRLVIDPWRAAPPLGAPWFDARWIARLWVGVAVLLLLRAQKRPGQRAADGSDMLVEVRLADRRFS